MATCTHPECQRGGHGVRLECRYPQGGNTVATSMFSRRHYEAVAAILSQNKIVTPETWENIRDDLGALFEADNEKFNRDKWEEVCER